MIRISEQGPMGSQFTQIGFAAPDKPFFAQICRDPKGPVGIEENTRAWHRKGDRGSCERDRTDGRPSRAKQSETD